jgi:type III pantothenate kinase
MLILLDAGNTRLKWGAWARGAWRARGALDNDRIDGLAEALAGYAPTWIGVSCVAGEAVRAGIADYARGVGVAPYWLRPTARLHGLANHYARPESLGSDRFAAVFACHCLDLAPCVMATAGTALTVDALSSRGEFLGGLILPGAGLMRGALARGTAGLADSSGVCQDFPRATGDAIESGIHAALAGAIEAQRARLAAREGGGVAVVLSGGDAAWLRPGLAGDVQVREDMVLEGLLWIAKRSAAADA